MKLYFAYGANLNQAGMRFRCPNAVAVQPFYLTDYRLAFSGVATIQPAPGERVAGALWAITEDCELSLDRFEGYPAMYRKEYITVDGMEIMFYRMNSEEPWGPGEGYLATIIEGYWDFGLPVEDLESAVNWTLEECRRYDRKLDEDLAMDEYLESGYDLRWLRDYWCTDADPRNDRQIQ